MKRKTMNKIIYISALVLGGCITSNGSNDKDSGSKLPAEGKSIEIKSFKAIRADGVFNIYLSQGGKEGVTVKGYYPKDLVIKNIGDTLVLEDTGSSHTNHMHINTDIYVTLNDINYMEISSVGETESNDTLKLKYLTFQSEGVGKLGLKLNADSIVGSEDGVGDMYLAGKSRYAEISDNGVGALRASDFMVDVLHVSVNGVGGAKVYANKEIYMQISGVGGVKYYGPAKVMQSESDGIGGVSHGD